MSEADAVARVHLPATVESLAAELAELGVRAGDVLLVHSSLSALGWVAGGAVAVIEALEHALGGEGTLVMPAFSTDLSDPSRWQHPPVPRGWWPVIRDHLPAFDPRRTPTRAMGAIAELFRTLPGVLRSAHPTASFAAAGPRAAELIREHPLEDPLGEDSPLGRLHELGARVLLLGVGHDRNTSLHLAERRAFRHLQALERTGSPLLHGGVRRWVEYQTPAVWCDDFAALGAAFEADPRRVRRGAIGAGTGRLLAQRELVAFGAEWLAQRRAADGRPAGG